MDDLVASSVTPPTAPHQAGRGWLKTTIKEGRVQYVENIMQLLELALEGE